MLLLFWCRRTVDKISARFLSFTIIKIVPLSHRRECCHLDTSFVVCLFLGCFFGYFLSQIAHTFSSHVASICANAKERAKWRAKLTSATLRRFQHSHNKKKLCFETYVY